MQFEREAIWAIGDPLMNFKTSVGLKSSLDGLLNPLPYRDLPD